MRYDVLIKGGMLFDGTGAPGFKGDLAVADGRIAAIGLSLTGEASTTLDAAGLAVCPGFIDIKTHSDFTLPINPKAESKIRQGVTTEIIGHCGFSVAPVLPGKVALLQDYLSSSAFWLVFKETTFAEYMDSFPATSVNAGMLVGHNTLRLMVMGMDERPPVAAELDAMRALLEEGLAAGALGLSTGLFTTPGAYADREEIFALGDSVRRHRAGYFTHLRDESSGVLEAVDEAIEVAERCGVHVQIVHFKCSGSDAWGLATTAMDRIAAARARGLDVDCDAYPYATGTNPLRNLMPRWVTSGGAGAMLERLRLAPTRQRIRADIARDGLNNWGRVPSWACVQVLISPRDPEIAGQTIASLAASRQHDPVDVVCDCLIKDQGATRVLVHSMLEDDVRELVRSPTAFIGSDGNCVADHGVTSKALAHPRFYGTFPRVLGRYVGQLGLLPLELAIHKMTGGPARALKLRDRGLLREGWRADITMFDPEDFVDQATFEHPHRYPTGARTSVLVNGVVVLRDATHTGARPGAVLRRANDGFVD